MQLVSVILAAGQGTRMKSSVPKVLHPLGGRPLVLYAVDTALAVTGRSPVLVVGHGAEDIRRIVGDRARIRIPGTATGHRPRRPPGP